MPRITVKHRHALSKVQMQVLRVLAKAHGPISRMEIIRRTKREKSWTRTFWSVGYSDPIARKKFERSKYAQNRLSLLTQGFVREVEIDVDGRAETGIELTRAGRAAYRAHRHLIKKLKVAV